MASIALTLPERELAALRQVLSPQQYKQAMFQATNRTTRRGRVLSGDAVRSRLTVRKKFIDSPSSESAAIKSRFDRSTQTGKIITTNIPIPLSEFTNTAGAAGVTVQFDTARPALHLRHAFKARVRSSQQRAAGLAGHVGIMTRKKIGGAVAAWYQKNFPGMDPKVLGREYGPGETTSTFKSLARGRVTEKGYAWRLPIEEQFGPSVFGLVSQNDVLDPLLKQIHNIFREEIGNQISRFTGGKITSLSALTIDTGDNEQ